MFTFEKVLIYFKIRIIKVFIIEKRIYIIMANKISNFPRYNMIFKQFNLSNFNFKIPKNNYIKKLLKRKIKY